MIDAPRWLVRGLVIAFALFTFVLGGVVLVTKPHAPWSAVGLAIFAAALLAGRALRRDAVSSGPLATVIAAVGLLLPLLGSVALDPVEDSFSSGAWYVGGVVCLVVVLLLSHRRTYAWIVLTGLVVQTLVWSGPSGLLRFGILATLLMIAVVTASAWAIGVTGAEITRHSESERQAATWRAAQDAYRAERQVRLANTALVAAPMLRAIAAQGGRLTDADRAECRLLEQTLRDEIRGRRLLNHAVREQVMAHRRRGALVQVNDDGGLDDLDPVRLDGLLGEVAIAVDGLASDRIIIRTAPPGSATALTVVAMSVDPTAAALGLDDGDDHVDLWLELPRIALRSDELDAPAAAAGAAAAAGS